MDNGLNGASRLRVDLAGGRFGRLAAIRKVERKGQATYWLCQCTCGNTTVVKAGNLRSGNTKSCGCMRMEMLRKGLNTPGCLSKTGGS